MSKSYSSHDVGGGENECGDVDVQLLLETSGIFSRLGPDIFLDIMSRVPLKSLSQCRWVCKSWYNLVRSTSFAKIQYEWAIKNNSPWVFLWTLTKDLYLVDDQVFYNLETSATAHDLELEFPRSFQIAGFVNGLLCAASEPANYYPSSICICNPITGEQISIPKSPKYATPAIAAFGFDPTTNEYKVIRFINHKDKNGSYLSSEGEVYTLGSTEWRKIDVPRITQHCGVLLNGNLHWISLYDSPIIHTFNVGSEKFGVIQLPPDILVRAFTDELLVGFELLLRALTNKRLVVLDGHLCFLYKELLKPFELWMMEDYEVQSSWAKIYSFDSNVTTWSVSSWSMYGSHDLIKLRNGEFLLQFEESENEFLGYFGPEKNIFRPIRIMRHNGDPMVEDYFRSVVQVGSLFSPKDAGKLRRDEEDRTSRG